MDEQDVTESTDDLREYALELKRAEQDRQELARARDDAEAARAQAEYTLMYTAKEAAKHIGYRLSSVTPGESERVSIAGALRQAVSRAHESPGFYPGGATAVEGLLSKLEERELALAAAHEHVASAREAHEAAEANVAELEASQPRVGAIELEAAAARVNSKRDKYELIVDRLGSARAELDAIRSRDTSHLDELEAKAALGDGPAGVSGAELTKARGELAAAEAEEARLEARIRGLEDLATKEARELAELEEAHRLAGLTTAIADQVKRERKLLKCYADLEKAAHQVNEGRRKVNTLLPEGEGHTMLKLRVSEPQLYEVPENLESTPALSIMRR